MYKLVIIDDEPLIRNGLKSLVERLCENWVVVGMAENAESGLDFIRLEKPDVAIVDVCMEGMSGLQMIEQAHAEKLETEFIVLSGYNEFQYVQQALRLRVCDYLLKPINRVELVRLLKGVEAKHQDSVRDKGKENMEKFSIESKTYLLEQTIHRLINGNLNLENRQREILNDFQIDFEQQFYLFYRMEIQLDSLKDRIESPKDEELFLLFCRQVIDEHVKQFGGKSFLFLDAHSIPLVLFMSRTKSELLTKQVFEMVENIRLVIRNYGKIELNISSSCVLTGLSNVQVAYGQTQGYSKTSWMEEPVNRAMDYISRNYAESLNLKTIAEKVHLNSNYFSDLFHKKTGIRFVQYLTFIRIEEAARLLRESKLPVQEIIERVGYRNYRQFNRVFQKQFLLTPTEYRKNFWK